VYDLAHSGDFFFIVREYLPLSLVDLLTGKSLLPLPFVIFLGYQILEGIGDLHLRMGRDKQIRNIFHLDLRPSRILLHDQRPIVKIYNGGLWKELETCNPKWTSMHRLPLPFLAYRAPEQFRPYLARRRPPVFTDIYLFGIVFFEMLTGNPAFRASSFEEYEIQHCEQYPSSPKMWRPEIPDELNDMIMTCLARDPMKRWRSTTQMSLILEKVFSQQIQASAREGPYSRYMSEILAS
jgi:serine/threonine-protein kinase